MKKSVSITFLIMALLTSVAEAEPQIIDIALATNIDGRQPLGIFSPPGTCRNIDNPPTNIPVIDSRIHRKVFVWTKVKSSDSFVLRHAYYKDGIEFKTQRTLTPHIDKVMQIIDEIKVGLGWKNIANVELKIDESSGWRTWSSKEIDPIIHEGNWRVEITPTNDDENILCVVHFKVE